MRLQKQHHFLKVLDNNHDIWNNYLIAVSVDNDVLIVIGDRRILRFLRGKQLNVDEATPMYADFLKWRRENNVDFIRQDIIYGGKTSPFKFPNGKKIIDLAPQIIITRHATDKKGQPLGIHSGFDF